MAAEPELCVGVVVLPVETVEALLGLPAGHRITTMWINNEARSLKVQVVGPLMPKYWSWGQVHVVNDPYKSRTTGDIEWTWEPLLRSMRDDPPGSGLDCSMCRSEGADNG